MGTTKISQQITKAKEKLDSDFYGSDAGKTMYYLDKINGAAGGTLDILNKGLDLINPLRSKIPNGPRKLQEKFNPKTGGIENGYHNN